MNNLSLTLILALGAALASCGKEEDEIRKKPTGESGPQGADLVAAVTCSGAPATPAALALDEAAAADGIELRRVPADSLRVMSGNRVRTMCDILKDRKQEIALFQFTSVTCFPCMRWVASVASGLEAQGLESTLLQVVVVTDPMGYLSTDDERRLKREVAKSAAWVYDDFGDLWSFFAPGSPSDVLPATTPYTVMMDAAARGFAVQDPTWDAAALVAKGNELLDAGLVATAPAAP